MSTLLQQLNNEIGGMVATVEPSLVQVRNGGNRAGAGTIWHPDGLVITNAHVICQGPTQITTADGTTFPAKLLARDQDRDIAALAVEATGLPAVKLGDSASLKPGQWVLALGHPWGIAGAATAGVIIGTGPHKGEATEQDREWIVVDLGLRPGYSGGPLIDMDGRLVGINTMLTGPDVGMAIPVHVLKEFLREKLGSQNAVSRS